MDAAKLQEAMDYGTANLGFAVRVYRRGCLVGEDRSASTNRNSTFESWSMAKSVTALMFGRAMQLGLIDPEDPVGSLVPEADAAHGRITKRDLLTMTSGLRWNGLRDYNIFTMPDRVRDALTLGVAHPPRPLLRVRAEPGVAAGRGDRPLGRDGRRQVRAGAADDPARHPRGDLALDARPGGPHRRLLRREHAPDDFGRLGELMRRGGVWRGRRLLDPYFMGQAIKPTSTNGCYGWLIWLNAAQAVRRPADHRAARRPTSATSPTCPPTSTASRACSGSSSPCSRRRTW